MRFEFKQVPFPKAAKKSMPPQCEKEAFKVRQDKKVIGTVLHAYADGGELWAYFREGKVFGGYQTRQAAAEGLAES